MKTLLALTVFTLCMCGVAAAQIKLPQIISDGMILQRDAKLKIWGWSSPKEKIKIKFRGKKFSTSADDTGKWLIMMPAMEAGGPYTMELEGKNKIELKDILIGEVWLCSGQSNMEHYMAQHIVTYAQEVASVNNQQLRQFKIPNHPVMSGPENDVLPSSWKWANPENILNFTAVGYFFAKEINAKYHVPVGIINSSVGGTPIEAWTSEEGYKNYPEITSIINRNRDTAFLNGLQRNALNGRPANPPVRKDKGLAGNIKWYEESYIPQGWRNIAVPGYWEDQGVKDLDGIVWYRKEIELPASMAGQPGRIFLGRIVDADNVYLNGKEIGNTTYLYPQRRYTIPANLLKAGKNLLVVKVTNNSGKGGFVPDKPYQLFTATDTVGLQGYWQYKVGEVFVPRRGGGFGGGPIAAQNQPTALYNGMIAPITNYAVKGFLWYQGESNSGKPQDYKNLQTTQIADWRAHWQMGNLPFLFVQLPGYMDYNYLPSESGWAMFREAQLQSLSAPNTGMAIAIDLGEWNDIHPDNKEDVGKRLALLAEEKAYNEKMESSGPLFSFAEIADGKIIVSFSHAGGLHTSDGDAPAEFAIAGADKKFVWAQTKIDGDKIIVWNGEVKQPMFVRYAWADNPVNPNLYNAAGLPASPFRTDK